MAQSSRKQVVMYLLFVVLFSSVFNALVLHAGHLDAGGYVFGIMWCPALAAFATLKLNHRSFSELGWKWPEKHLALMSWWVPLVYTIIAYTIIWVAGFGGFPNHDFMNSLVARMGERWSPVASTILYVAFTGTFGVIRSMVSALGEEIGWRGFLVPELSKTTSFTVTAFISGSVWATWHWPLLIYGGYNNGTPAWFGLSCFTVMVVAVAFIFAWMRLKSGSLWTGALLHASHNLYVQAIFTPLTRDTGKTAWYIDEFGAILPLVVVAFAIYFWTRRKELSLPTTSAPTSVAAVALR